jgi:hypothetical protein
MSATTNTQRPGASAAPPSTITPIEPNTNNNPATLPPTTQNSTSRLPGLQPQVGHHDRPLSASLPAALKESTSTAETAATGGHHEPSASCLPTTQELDVDRSDRRMMTVELAGGETHAVPVDDDAIGRNPSQPQPNPQPNLSLLTLT